MPEILRFSTNIPEIVSLRFAEGKLKPSTLPNTPPDVQFTLVDGRTMYLPTAAAEEIYRNRIQAGAPLQVCRRQGGKFEITPMSIEASAPAFHSNNAPAPVQPAAPATHERAQVSTPAANQAPAITPASARVTRRAPQPDPDPWSPEGYAASTPPAQRSAAPVQLPHPQAGPLSPTSLRFMGAYKDAVDALLETQGYAKSKGLLLDIRCEDVRCLAATMMIQASKDAGGR